MDCQQVKLALSEYVDGRVTEAERLHLQAHLRDCAGCRTRQSEMVGIRDLLRATPPRPIPNHLKLALQVAGSKQAERQRYAGVGGWLKARHAEIRLITGNMMRPLALPAAGGLVTAVFLFTMVMTNFQGIARAHENDVPTVFATDARFLSSTMDFATDEIVLDVLVDEQGRVIDYEVPRGFQVASNETRRKLENSLLFTRFAPATSFGQPVPGWVRVSFRRNEIDVKG